MVPGPRTKMPYAMEVRAHTRVKLFVAGDSYKARESELLLVRASSSPTKIRLIQSGFDRPSKSQWFAH